MKRKYARFGDEKSGVYECTNRKCKWQGVDEEKFRKKGEAIDVNTLSVNPYSADYDTD